MSITEDRQEAQVYEVGYLVLPSIPEESLPNTVSKINSAIEAAGGTRIDGEDPFLMDLAYQMKKAVGARNYVVDEAYIGWTKFECEPARVEEVKNALEKMEEILRSLIMKAPRETTFTFALARAKELAAIKAENEAKEADTTAIDTTTEAQPEPVVE